ncbi:MAG TPA: carboxypeptidase-like regulatory domain-containing protein [Thermoanaerobaculia bacterium]|nr:carboxypeptidase-like regulatory domain-containing protein [Thermoanaerobaculia bacterium]
MKRWLVLLSLFFAAVPLMAKTIRISGTIEGPYDPPLTVRVGSGPPAAAVLRRLGAPDAYGLGRTDGSVAGIEIPPSPSQWHSAAVDGARFVSDAIDAGKSPVLVVFDANKRLRIVDVAVPPDIADGATVDAGTWTLEPTRSVAIDLELPLTDLAMVFLLGVPEARVNDRDRAAIARQLSVLDQVAPRTFDLLASGDALPLPDSGRTVLEALPPYESLRIAISSAAADVEVLRDVPLTAGAAMRVARAELTPRKFATRRIAGRVVDGDERPVRGATVVVSDFPSRREATTDAAGRFVVRAMLSGPRANFLVDADNKGNTTLARNVAVDEGDVHLRVANVGALPQTFTALANPARGNLITRCLEDLQYPAIGGVRNFGTSSEGYGSIEVEEVSPSLPAIDVTVKDGGPWLFIWAVDPFQVVQGTHTFPSGGGNATVMMAAPGPTVPRALQFVDSSGKAIPDLTVYLTSVIGGPDPITLITDDKGTIELDCVNIPWLQVVIDDDPWTFDGDVKLAGAMTIVPVGKASPTSEPAAKPTTRKRLKKE